MNLFLTATPSADLSQFAADFPEVLSMIGDGIESMFGYMTKFPINIFLGAAVIGIGISIFRSIKRG